MQVPVYNKQVNLNTPRAAGDQVKLPTLEQFDNGAKAVGQLAGALNEAGNAVQSAYGAYKKRMDAAYDRQLERESAQRTTDALLGFEREMSELLNGKVAEDGTITEGLYNRTGEKSKGVALDYQKQAEALYDKYIAYARSNREFDALDKAFRQKQLSNYDNVVRFEAGEGKKLTNGRTKAYLELSAGEAAAITDPNAMINHLSTQYVINATTGKGNGETNEEISASNAKVAYNNVKASVDASIGRLNFPQALNMIKSLKNDLSPDDYEKLKATTEKAKLVWEEAQERKEERAERKREREEAKAEKAAKKAQQEIDANSKQVLYSKMFDKLATNPDGLQREINEAARDPYAAIATYNQEYGINIKPTDIQTYLNHAQSLLDDPDTAAGQAKIENYLILQKDTDAFKFEVDKKNKDKVTVGNKELRDPIALLGYITQLDANIKNHAFNKEDTKEATKHLATARKALSQVAPKIDTESALGAAVKEIHTLIDGGKTQVGIKKNQTFRSGFMGDTYAVEVETPDYQEFGGILTQEETSKALENATKKLYSAGINLTSEDAKDIAAARVAVQTSLHDTISQKFAIDTEDVTDVQYGNNTFKSYGLKANPNSGTALSSNLKGYRYEERNNFAFLVLRDENGNIIREVLSPWKPTNKQTK